MEVKYTLLGIIPILIWGLAVAICRSLSEAIGTFTSGSIITFLASILLAAWLIKRKEFNLNRVLQNKKYLIVCGVCFIVDLTLFYLLVALAKDRLQTMELALINYTWSIQIVIVSVIMFKKDYSKSLYLGIGLALVGMYLAIFNQNLFSFTAILNNILNYPHLYLIAFLAALGWALYTNFSKLLSSDEGLTPICIFLFISSLFFAFYGFLYEEHNWSLRVLLELIYGCSTAAIAYACWDIASKKGNVTLLGTFSYLMPVLTTIGSSMYLGVLPGTALWVGSILLVIAAYISNHAID